MDKCREEFQKAFPIPAHWVEFDEKTNRYYCPYVADATASKYQSQWVVWQHLYEKMGELETAIDSLSDENAHFRNKKWDQNEDFTKLQAKVEELQKQLSEYIFVAETLDEMYVKEVKSSDELQKRVDQQGLIIAKAMSIASDLQKSWSMFEIGKKLEQALKGEG
ncbi:hypothetical protein KTJ07_12190 [Acinetobacter baumannii]|nr:hypothetical protein [Acinetobacter baumannii]